VTGLVRQNAIQRLVIVCMLCAKGRRTLRMRKLIFAPGLFNFFQKYLLCSAVY
jgi:hypothetical protein